MRTWISVTAVLGILGLIWAGAALSQHVNEKAVAKALEKSETLQLWQDEDWRITQQGVLIPDAQFVSHHTQGSL